MITRENAKKTKESHDKVKAAHAAWEKWWADNVLHDPKVTSYDLSIANTRLIRKAFFANYRPRIEFERI